MLINIRSMRFLWSNAGFPYNEVQSADQVHLLDFKNVRCSLTLC
jgi:hypothetical protein